MVDANNAHIHHNTLIARSNDPVSRFARLPQRFGLKDFRLSG